MDSRCGVLGGGAAAYLWTPAGSRRRVGSQTRRRDRPAGRAVGVGGSFRFLLRGGAGESARADTCGGMHGPCQLFFDPTFLPP